MKPRVIIFDLDGVLFDTGEMAFQAMKESYPELTREMQSEMLCGNFHEAWAKTTLSKRIVTDEEKAERRAAYSKKKAKAPLFPGAKAALEKLHADGYTLVVNTSAAERNCLPLLEHNGLAGLFDFLATAETSKSKVEKFAMIGERYALPTRELIFVTDTLGDIREADTADVPTVAVTWGFHDRSHFTREAHTTLIGIVDSFDGLIDRIEKPKASELS